MDNLTVDTNSPSSMPGYSRMAPPGGCVGKSADDGASPSPSTSTGEVDQWGKRHLDQVTFLGQVEDMWGENGEAIKQIKVIMDANLAPWGDADGADEAGGSPSPSTFSGEVDKWETLRLHQDAFLMRMKAVWGENGKMTKQIKAIMDERKGQAKRLNEIVEILKEEQKFANKAAIGLAQLGLQELQSAQRMAEELELVASSNQPQQKNDPQRDLQQE